MKKSSQSSFSDKAQSLAAEAKSDKQAFSELICMYTKAVQKSVVSMAETPDEVNDLTQEGLLGLFEAVKTYDQSKGVLFSTYANVCIRNKIVSAIRKKTRCAEDISSGVAVSEESYADDPERVAIDRVMTAQLRGMIVRSLSKKEWQIFEKYLEGGSYENIASELEMPVKSVDNAMQRVRRKLKAVLDPT